MSDLWSAPAPNPLLNLLHAAARGTFPDGDFSTTHLPSPASAADAVLAFFGHHVIASDVSAEFVSAWTTHNPFALSDVRFLAALANQLDVAPSIYDAVFASPGQGFPPDACGLIELHESDHPRVVRAQSYRDPATIRIFTDPSQQSVLVMGRGLAGRLEAAYEVNEAARGAGIGRALIKAARSIAPLDEPVFLEISPGNVWSMKALFGDPNWRPVGSELLFLRR
jgi:GNAT superfamily N-acetyltransferase